MAQQLAMCSYRILARLATDAKHKPAIDKEAIAAYKSLVAEIGPALTCETGKSIVASFAALEDSETASPQDYFNAEQAIQNLVSLIADQNDDTSIALLQKISAINYQHEQAFQQAYEQELAGLEQENTTNEEADVFTVEQKSNLVRFINDTFAEDVTIENLKLIPGGFSKQTIFVSLGNVTQLPDTLVIRLDKADSPVGSTVTDEFNIIKTLFAADVAVPQAYALEESGNVLGGAFMLLSRIEGSNVGDVLDVNSGSRALALHLAKTLAKMHSVNSEAFGDNLPGANCSTQERLLAELEGFEQQWRSFDDPSIALETAFSWLKKNIAAADGPRSLVHKDLGSHNFLAQDDKVTALLDWESAAIGNPAQDLGYLYPTVTQICDWESFIQHYQAHGGPVTSAEQIEFYRVWGNTWLSVLIGSAGFAFKSGATDDVQLGYVASHLLARIDSRLVSLLHEIY